MSEGRNTVQVALLYVVGFFRATWSVAGLGLSNCLTGLLHRLAAICVHNADYWHALIAYRTILRVKPNDRAAIFRLVDLHSMLSKDDESIPIIQGWLRLAPNDLEAHAILAELYTESNEMSRAMEHLDTCSRIAPNSLTVLLSSGYFYRWKGNLEESTSFLTVARKHRENVRSLSLLSQNLIDQGKKTEAISMLERGIRLAPDFAFLYYLLARCGYYRTSSHPHITHMRRRISSNDLPAHVQSVFHFALGEAYDCVGLWDMAFSHFKAGNDLRDRCFNFNINDAVTVIDNQIEIFTRELFLLNQWAAVDSIDQSLIFVFGMPRSGTTLVEQILASHPRVRAGGERRDIPAIMDFLCSNLVEPYPSCIRRLNHQLIEGIAQMYQTRLSSLTGSTWRVVDKALGNWFACGLIGILFPRAKLVHCHRDPLDTCLSCYCTYLPQMEYTHDLTNLGLFYCQYERLMAHWRSVLPRRILDLQYEDLVGDPEPQIRNLLDYCELHWDDGCLNPHRTQRVVNTASSTQVKQAIYTRSVGRWKNYEKHLGQLIAALNGLAHTMSDC